jgi:restriction system protein
MSFLDAAEDVLRRSADEAPMHYRQITEQALSEGLIESAGLTPDATLRAQIGVENRRREARGDRPRFVEHGRGVIGLSEWDQESVLREIERHNEQRRAELLQRVKDGSARDFEQLVSELLSAQGFEIEAVTPYSNGKGVDVRARRWWAGSSRPRSPCRPSAGTATTSERRLCASCAAASARTSAGSSSPLATSAPVPERKPSAPTRRRSLVNGQEMVSQMVEHGIGVRRSAHDVIELAETLPGPGAAAGDAVTPAP